MKRIYTLITICILLSAASTGYAYKIGNDMISPTGGSLSTAAYTIIKHNMQPYSPLTQSDLDMVYATAVGDLNQTKSFKDSLTFYNCQPSDTNCKN